MLIEQQPVYNHNFVYRDLDSDHSFQVHMVTVIRDCLYYAGHHIYT